MPFALEDQRVVLPYLQPPENLVIRNSGLQAGSAYHFNDRILTRELEPMLEFTGGAIGFIGRNPEFRFCLKGELECDLGKRDSRERLAPS